MATASYFSENVSNALNLDLEIMTEVQNSVLN
jgi:hypothetical protein